MTAPRPGGSGAWATARLTLGVLLLVVAQFALGPLLENPLRVDFLAIAVLFAAVRLRPGMAAVVGFLAGATLDAIAPEAFGAGMLSFAVVAAAAARLRTAFFADNVGLTGGFVLVGAWLSTVLHDVLAGALAAPAPLARLFVWAPASAAVTAVVAVLLLTLFGPVYAPRGR